MRTFQEASCEAARLFLQTVVIVDNQVGFESGDQTDLVVDTTDPLAEPTDFDTAPAEQIPSVAKETPNDAPLNATAITEAFAMHGLVCGILKPTKENRLNSAAALASERADVLVLDWEMGDTGQLATEIARNLLTKDSLDGGKLRLIAIYTGRPQLNNVRAGFKSHYSQLEGKAKSNGELSGPALSLSKTDILIDVGHARIIFLSKNAPQLGDPENHLAVPEDELPERLLTEFANFAGGLLSNATLASIAELRRHTHRMLARFDKKLDGAILTNRTLVKHKEDAEEIAAGLILAELESKVPLGRIAREFMGADSIRAYFEHRKDLALPPPSFMKDSDGKHLHQLDTEEVCKLIEEGLASFDDATLDGYALSVGAEAAAYRETIKSSFHKRLYGLTGTVKDGRAAHEQFAVVSMMRRDITGVGPWKDGNRPIIKLGTIIARDDLFWACLAPPCDCVRLCDGKAALLFTQLHKDSSSFEIVVPKDNKGDGVAKLRTKPKEMQLVTMNFSGIENGVVTAKIKGDQAVFEAWPLNSDKKSAADYRWVGELKPMQAQRLVQNFASNMARVGVDENEWHRLQFPPG